MKCPTVHNDTGDAGNRGNPLIIKSTLTDVTLGVEKTASVSMRLTFI
jgi:hypothetical protein